MRPEQLTFDSFVQAQWAVYIVGAILGVLVFYPYKRFKRARGIAIIGEVGQMIGWLILTAVVLPAIDIGGDVLAMCSTSIAAATWIALVGVLLIFGCGIGLFRLRKHSRALYGLVEVVFGIVSIMSPFSQHIILASPIVWPWQQFVPSMSSVVITHNTFGPNSLLPIGAGLYVMIRGLDNIEQSAASVTRTWWWNGIFGRLAIK